MRRNLIVAFTLCVLLTGGCRVYEVYRGARVPRPTPTPRSGVPIGNALEVGLTGSTLAEVGSPELGDSSAGVHVPRHQARADVRMSPTSIPELDVGLVYEHGFESGSHALAKGSPEPNGATTGLGMSAHYSLGRADSPLRAGLGMDFLLFGVPWVEYRVCTNNCIGGPFTTSDEGISVHPVVALSLAPNYQVAPEWTVFGSMTVRNHPTIERTGIEVGIDVGEEVDSGPLNVTVAAGVEYAHAGSGLRASVMVYQIATRDPVHYLPTMALSLSIPLLGHPTGRPAAPDPAAATPPMRLIRPGARTTTDGGSP